MLLKIVHLCLLKRNNMNDLKNTVFTKDFLKWVGIKLPIFVVAIAIHTSCKKEKVTQSNEEQSFPLTINTSHVVLNVSEQEQLESTGNTVNVQWICLDTIVAEIDQNGLLRGKTSGITKVVAFANGDSDTCVVQVNETLFLSGYVYDPNIEVGMALLWINGEEIELGSDFTSGLNVWNGVSYVSGTQGADGYTSKAKLWTKMLESDLSSFGTFASSTSIHVDPTGVYTSGWYEGSSNSIACYWKDEVKTDLTLGNFAAKTNDIAVGSSGDPYVVGYLDDANFISRAVLWSNSNEIILSSEPSDAYAIDLEGGNVLIGGRVYNSATSTFLATIWENQVATHLTAGNFNASVSDVLFSNGDVYAVGYSKNNSNQSTIATVWKNGFRTELTDGSTEAVATAVEVFNGDVYIAGYISDGFKKNGVVWKNGVIIQEIISHPQDVIITGMSIK